MAATGLAVAILATSSGSFSFSPAFAAVGAVAAASNVTFAQRSSQSRRLLHFI